MWFPKWGGSVQQVKVDTIVNTSSSTATFSIDLGFKPKQLAIYTIKSTLKLVLHYDERRTTEKYFRAFIDSGTSFQDASLPNTTGNGISSIDSSGFTVKVGGNETFYYFAIG